MKKKRYGGALRGLLYSVLYAVLFARRLPLDDGIAQIAGDLEAGLPENTRIAVVNFESSSARFCDYVLEELRGFWRTTNV